MAERVAPTGEADALARDQADPLSRFRDRFLLPEAPDGAPAIYLAGQSLGLQPRTVRAAIEAELDAWARLGIDGHFAPGRPASPDPDGRATLPLGSACPDQPPGSARTRLGDGPDRGRTADR